MPFRDLALSPTFETYLLRADLSYVFTASEASQPIKIYNPELMVIPVYNSDCLAGNGSRSDGEEEMVQTVKLAMPRFDKDSMAVTVYIIAVECKMQISYQPATK